MEQSTIDIGITVNATLYLHELNNDNEACRIDAKDVEGVSKTNALYYRKEALDRIKSLLQG